MAFPHERAIWHEAGHAVVALSISLAAADIWYKNGNFEATYGLAQRSRVPLHHIYTVLAAGAASEKLKFDDYDTKGSSADATRISDLGGVTIENYLPEALKILGVHRRELEGMARELQAKWAQSLFTGRPNPFRVMLAEEVDAVYKAVAAGQTTAE
jgi:hypothetical protein